MMTKLLIIVTVVCCVLIAMTNDRAIATIILSIWVFSVLGG